MYKLLLPLSLMFLMACSTTKKIDRGFASVESDPGLTGTILGYITHITKIKEKKNKTKKLGYKRATRVYFRKAKENDGSYNVVFLEYVNLLKMGPKYILSNKGPKWLNKKIGFLNGIVDRAVMYKAYPTSDVKTYELQRLSYNNGKLVAANSSKPSLLKLEKEPSEKNPLEGARITMSEDGEPGEVYFPYLDKKVRKQRKKQKVVRKPGFQYNMAQFVYNLYDNFKSTWRTSYLPGDYLGAYNDKEDVILNLASSSAGENTANFFLNQSRSHFSKKKREKQLTNAKSAYITGDYNVSEVDDGIFIFNANPNSAHTGAESVDQKIGLFIDIFDASETKLNQDVVELIILNTENPKDFLMYYEHPDNGEGN